MTDYSFPNMRGKLTPQRQMSDLTWLRVGGPAEFMFQPADADDVATFLHALPAEAPMRSHLKVIVLP